MTNERRDEIISKIRSMPKKEVKAIVTKACEDAGLTYEEFVSTDWDDFFNRFKKPDFTNHTGNALDYPN